MIEKSRRSDRPGDTPSYRGCTCTWRVDCLFVTFFMLPNFISTTQIPFSRIFNRSITDPQTDWRTNGPSDTRMHQKVSFLVFLRKLNCRPTDQPTDGPRDIPSYKYMKMHMERWLLVHQDMNAAQHLFSPRNSFPCVFNKSFTDRRNNGRTYQGTYPLTTI